MLHPIGHDTLTVSTYQAPSVEKALNIVLREPAENDAPQAIEAMQKLFSSAKENTMTDHQYSRRDFMKLSGAAACAAMLPGCAAVMKPMEKELEQMPVDDAWSPHVASAWIPKNAHVESPDDAYATFKKTVEAATDFSWLSAGDSVLIKLALNSGNPFPATTDPWSLSCMIRLLREKGAGQIRVGDSSGIESVHWTTQKQKGSSRALCKQAGLFDPIIENDAEPVFFEEAGYDGFFETAPVGGHHWQSPVWITSAVAEADHIIYLARVSSHVLGDITAGLKIGVGFLREDSRRVFHQGGDAFYAMYEEINHVPEIASKLRLTVSSGRKVLATFGPDNGHVAVPEFGLLFASEDLLAHEALSYAWLLYNREHETGFFDAGVTGRLTRMRSPINRGFVWYMWKDAGFFETPGIPLFIAGNIYAHPSMVNAMNRKGGRPVRIDWEPLNAPAGTEMMADYIKAKMEAPRQRFRG